MRLIMVVMLNSQQVNQRQDLLKIVTVSDGAQGAINWLLVAIIGTVPLRKHVGLAYTCIITTMHLLAKTKNE